MVVVSILRSGSSKYPNMMVLLHFLQVSLIAAHNSFALTPSYTYRQDNVISDALSCFDLQHYFLSSSSTCSSHRYTNAAITVGPTSCDLTGKCQFHLTNGLAHSSRQVYGSAQHQFLEFCSQDFPSGLGHSLLPASEQTLMRFCAHLADCLHHSSIKVYLLAVHSLHIDYGYPDPLSNCLQLKPFLREIKENQVSNLPQHQPVTADLMAVLWQSLDLSNPDKVLLWAALAFSGSFKPGNSQ